MDLPYLTADLPGTGGVLRSRPEDFVVNEIPLYEPVGEGSHVLFRIRKRAIDTFEAVRRIARALGVEEKQFRYAGLKDARAVATQWMSTEAADEERIRALSIDKLQILEVARHLNGLKLGHLRGNRFDIVVRRTRPGSHAQAEETLSVLVRRGAPNFFGQQRFGTRLNSHLCGEALLRRDYERFAKRLIGGASTLERDPYLTEARRLFDEGRLDEAYAMMPIRQRMEKKALHALIRFKDYERAYFAIPKRMRQMFVSAYQSSLFNRVLERRVQEIDRVQEGDLAYLHRNGAVFSVEQAATDQARCRAFEISPSAPVYGTKTPLARGAPGAIEAQVLEEAGVELSSFDVGGGLNARGNRRSMRVPLRDVACEALDDTSFRISFALPPGCYATSVLREITKD